jgi:hypothetical protein
VKASVKSTRRPSSKKKQRVALPVDDSPIESYPVGSCVRVGSSWYLVAMRIGTGFPHLRLLASDPRADGWLVGTGPALESKSATVSESCWPWRRQEVSDGDEVDPLALGDLAAREVERAREGVI